jgi:hypothetical protein
VAVVKATIKSQLLSLYNEAKTAPMTEDEFADGMADIIRAAILSADVASTGTATAVQSGPSTAPVTTTGALS